MSIRIDTSIWINRAPTDVFTFLTTAENLPKMVPNLTTATLREGNVGQGTIVDSKLKMMGSVVDLVAEWTRYEPGEALGIRNLEGPVGMESLVTLHAENGGTRVDRQMDLEPKGLIGSLTSPLIKRQASKDADAEFGRLKTMLEAAEA
jgi:carbon monoxide dehydrogenase subunit G